MVGVTECVTERAESLECVTGFLHVAGVMVGIKFRRSLDRMAEEAGYFPQRNAGLGHPSAAGVSQGMRCHIRQAGPAAGPGECLLDVANGAAVDVQDSQEARENERISGAHAERE